MYENIPGGSAEIKNRKNISMVKSRLAFVACFFILGFTAVSFKATEVMLFGDRFKKAANYKAMNKSNRAEIVDRNGVVVATNLRTQSAYANPREMFEVEDAIKKLSETLPNFDTNQFTKDVKRNGSFVWVKRNLTPREQGAINNLGIPGVYFTDDMARVYPQGKLLSHILGYVNVDNQGLAGIEREFDELLTWGAKEPLKLSIDVKLQHILHDELEKQVVDYRALGGAGMVIDVTNGEVLAMVSLPDFDPNSPGTASKDEKFNRVTLGTYEMGSTFKAYTAAIALDIGVATPETIYDATRPLQVGRQTIHDYHGKKRALTLTEVLMYSSNVGTARLAMSIGPEKLKEGLGKFGMYDLKTIEIPERGKPQVPKRWSDIVTMTVAFGHGIAVTPVHVLEGYQAIVNGGYIHPLSLIKKQPDDKIESIQVLSKHASDQMRIMLRDIVVSGTGRNADAEGYLVAGKTGTAEKQVGGRYVKEKVMSSFVGTFPINNPKYMILAIVDEPQEKVKGVRPTAGIVAAPIIKNFVGRAGPLLKIRPQTEAPRPKNEQYVIDGNVAGKTLHN